MGGSEGDEREMETGGEGEVRERRRKTEKGRSDTWQREGRVKRGQDWRKRES